MAKKRKKKVTKKAKAKAVKAKAAKAKRLRLKLKAAHLLEISVPKGHRPVVRRKRGKVEVLVVPPKMNRFGTGVQ